MCTKVIKVGAALSLSFLNVDGSNLSQPDIVGGRDLISPIGLNRRRPHRGS